MIRCGAIERDPFVNYRFQWKQAPRDFLSEEELTRIIEKKLATPGLEAVRDIFIFSCFSGLAYIDIANQKVARDMIAVASQIKGMSKSWK